MYGAIIGDIVGSIYEFNNIKTKDFPFVSKNCFFTDDTVMTIAVANALLISVKTKKPFKTILIEEMHRLGEIYQDYGYGLRFSIWLSDRNAGPYNSFGNGSAMRVSPCGLIAVSLDEALELAKASSEVTHNHPEGIKGAMATAAAVYLAKTGEDMESIRKYIDENFYRLDRTLDEIRPDYSFNETCQGSVPEAFTAFFESESYEDAIRNSVSLGGDSDTIAAIAGSIAWSYYRYNKQYADRSKKLTADLIGKYGIDSLLPEDFKNTIRELEAVSKARTESFSAGKYEKIILV